MVRQPGPLRPAARRPGDERDAAGSTTRSCSCRANGAQLTEITALIDAGTLRPVIDRIFPLASTNDALAYVESGRAKGKVVVTMR